MMILLTVGIGLVAGSSGPVSVFLVFYTLLGTGLIAASASILNQWLEQDRDALMPRTQDRPLPAGRLTSFEASTFGWITAVLGFSILLLGTTVSAFVVGLSTWTLYVWIYTPLKPITWWNTAVGSLPGALPLMIGWTAAGGSPTSWLGWGLTSVIILWQFPHFMSIAWLYRKQYTGAGYRMITDVDSTGALAGFHAIIPAILLLPLVYFVVFPTAIGSTLLACVAVFSGLPQVMASWRFMRCRSEQTARRLLHSSLVFLPTVMLILMVRFGMMSL